MEATLRRRAISSRHKAIKSCDEGCVAVSRVTATHCASNRVYGISELGGELLRPRVGLGNSAVP